MTQHTTHFEDCGCLAEQHAAEIAKALAERDAALRENLYYEKKIAGLVAEVERLRKAIQGALLWSAAWGHHHWDHTQQRGAGCERCLNQGIVRGNLEKALSGKDGREG